MCKLYHAKLSKENLNKRNMFQFSIIVLAYSVPPFDKNYANLEEYFWLLRSIITRGIFIQKYYLMYQIKYFCYY